MFIIIITAHAHHLVFLLRDTKMFSYSRLRAVNFFSFSPRTPPSLYIDRLLGGAWGPLWTSILPPAPTTSHWPCFCLKSSWFHTSYVRGDWGFQHSDWRQRNDRFCLLSLHRVVNICRWLDPPGVATRFPPPPMVTALMYTCHFSSPKY